MTSRTAHANTPHFSHGLLPDSKSFVISNAFLSEAYGSLVLAAASPISSMNSGPSPAISYLSALGDGDVGDSTFTLVASKAGAGGAL